MFPLCSLRLWSLCLFGMLVFPALGQPAQPTVVPVLHSRTVLLLVFAQVNGRGPYKFVLDTGSNITLIESSLFRELGLEARGTTSTRMMDGMVLGKLGLAQEISIGGESQKDVRVLEVDGIKRPDLDPDVRGVIGENFLRGFDLLIDNQRRVISFDNGTALTSSLAGEHLPLSFSAQIHGVEVKDRPLVWAAIPSLDDLHPFHLLLDTGSEAIYLLPREGSELRNLSVAQEARKTFTKSSGSSSCARWKGYLRLGETKTRQVKLNSCTDSPMGTSDHDGTLPTFLFKRLFISHAQGYVILDPVNVASFR